MHLGYATNLNRLSCTQPSPRVTLTHLFGEHSLVTVSVLTSFFTDLTLIFGRKYSKMREDKPRYVTDVCYLLTDISAKS